MVQKDIEIATVDDHGVSIHYAVQFDQETGKHMIVSRSYYRSGGSSVNSWTLAEVREQLFDGDDRGGDYLVYFRESKEVALRWVETATEPDELLRHYCRKYGKDEQDAERMFASIKASENLHTVRAQMLGNR